MINYSPDRLARDGHRVFYAGLPIAMHCHHYNLNLQKTLEDSLGDEGRKILLQAAEVSSFFGFSSVLAQHKQLKTVKSKLELAAISYQYCGLGVINFQNVSRSGGRISSPHSHHVTGWLAKYGKRDTPGCHFSRGWIAGVLRAIYDQPEGFYIVEEPHCKMMRDDECIFTVKTVENGKEKPS